MLRLESICKSYRGQLVLKEISFEILKSQPQNISIMGANGCGKTTLLKLLAGFERPSQGYIYWNDQILSSCDGPHQLPYQRNFTMVFQEPILFPHLSIKQNLEIPLLSKSKSFLLHKSTYKKWDSIIAMLKISDYLSLFPNDLSRGESQRVSIAQAILAEPNVILLDEPFSNIDSNARGEMMNTLFHYFKENLISTIFSTHSFSEASLHSEWTLFLKNGKLQSFVNPEKLIEMSDLLEYRFT